MLHVWKGRPDFPALKRKVQELAKEWHVTEILVEAAATGVPLCQELLEGWEGFDVPRIILREARAAKRLRMEMCAPMFEAGKVFFADGPWLPDAFDELAAVPDGCVHDDFADSLCQGLAYLREGYNVEPPPFIIDRHEDSGLNWLRQKLASAANSFESWGGFAVERPILPLPEHVMSTEAAQAATRVVEGTGDTVAAVEEVMWDSIREAMED